MWYGINETTFQQLIIYALLSPLSLYWSQLRCLLLAAAIALQKFLTCSAVCAVQQAGLVLKQYQASVTHLMHKTGKLDSYSRYPYPEKVFSKYTA